MASQPKPLVFDRPDTMYQAFFGGRCDAMTQDSSALASALATRGKPLDLAITATSEGLDVDLRGAAGNDVERRLFVGVGLLHRGDHPVDQRRRAHHVDAVFFDRLELARRSDRRVAL